MEIRCEHCNKKLSGKWNSMFVLMQPLEMFGIKSKAPSGPYTYCWDCSKALALSLGISGEEPFRSSDEAVYMDLSQLLRGDSYEKADKSGDSDDKGKSRDSF